MGPKHILSLLFLVVLFSCKNKTALQFNEAIISIERSLSPDIQPAEQKIVNYCEHQQYDSAAATSTAMESLVDSKLKEVEALTTPDVKEGENLKKAAVRYFEYLKGRFTSYKEFAVQTNDEARETARLNLVKITNQAGDALKDIQVAQKKYADANGFRLETK